MTDIAQAARRQRGRGRRALGAGRRQAPLEIVGARHQARRSAARRRRDLHARSFAASPASRSTSRRSWCCPPRPARRSPRSRRCSTSNNQVLAFEPIGLRAAARRRGRAAARIGGVHRRQSVRPAPDQGRRRARPFPRLHGRHRPRRDLQVRRPGGEERHRLRSLQADGRLLGHAGGADRGHDQGAAAGRRPRRPCVVARPRRRAGRARHGRGDGLAVRGVGRRASAGRMWRSASPSCRTAQAARPLLRLEGFAPSVDASQRRRSPQLLKPFGAVATA